jgi:surface protein
MSALVLVYNITVSSFTLVLPIQGGTITLIDWDDGTGTTNSHTYSNPGTYTVSVTGTGITNMNYTAGGSTGRQYLTECTSFGEIGLTNLTYAFNGCSNLIIVPSSLPTSSTVTNMGGMFQNATSFNQNISGWNVSSVTNMGDMFQNATSFNQNISGWNVSSVTNMSGMFSSAPAFNQNISGWNVSSVTLMNGMFADAISFNQDLGSWDVSSVTNITGIFSNSALSTTNYNNILNDWSLLTLQENLENVSSGLVYSPAGLTAHDNITADYNWQFIGDAYLSTNILKVGDVFSLAINRVDYFSYVGNDLQLYYDGEPFSSVVNYDGSSTTITFTNLVFTTSGNLSLVLKDITLDYNVTSYRFTVYSSTLVCFKEDSKILTNRGYIPIQHLRKGDLIQTLKDGFKPINMIGKKEIHHQASQEDRIKDQLYVCKKENYPDIKDEDLVITGCHSILVKSFKDDEQRENTIKINGDTYVTDDHYRLPACLDDKSLVYEPEGIYTIYHLALDHDNYFMNYGIYANGLLVESCTKNYLERLSGMTIIE